MHAPLAAMQYDTAVQIARRSPHARRRRRRAQQQSACCGCVLGTVIVVAAVLALKGPLASWRQKRQELADAQTAANVHFPLELATDSTWYYRHCLVTVILRITDAQGRVQKTGQPPEVFISHRGQVVETVGGVDRLKPRWDPAQNAYVAHWPVPWNASLGAYQVETRFRLAQPEAWRWETPDEEQRRIRRERRQRSKKDKPEEIAGEGFCVARCSFDVRGAQPPTLPAGMCAATWEEMLPSDGVRVRRPNGEMGDWRAIFEWCSFMGADTLWVRGALTSAATERLTMERPFVPSNLQLIPRLAAEAHRRGMKFGAWAMSYNTLPEQPGSNSRKPPYTWAKDISRSTGEVQETSFISLLDQRRLAHLSDFFAAMQADPNVDQVGLDYIRTEPGYELTDRFAYNMPVELPANWAKMKPTERWRYVAQRVEPPGCYQHTEFYDAWNWYRAHLGAETVARLIRRSGIKKPVWVFALSWRHGTQHGQDPLMFNDAGVSIIAPMLYQTDVRQFDGFIVRDWSQYLRPGQANLACGDQLDNYWHQQLGPGELYRRMMRAHMEFLSGGRTMGGFFHDISRAAVVGNLGPYPATEWALAGGAAFSKIRESARVYPIRAALACPTSCTVKQPIELRLTVENVCRTAVPRINVGVEWTEGVEAAQPSTRQIPQLGPGETLTIPFRVTIPARLPARQSRFMCAFRITWPAGEYGSGVRNDLPRTIIVMQYVKAQ
jgi:hypothetical protein